MDLGIGGKGGKKPLDSALNLVPFIDLMAVLIVFLIMSAVWTQLNRMQVSESGDGGRDIIDDPPWPVVVRMTESSFQVSVHTTQRPALTVTRDERGRIAVDALKSQLVEFKRTLPEGTTVTIFPVDSVKYEDLIRVIDAAMPSFPSVSVSSGS